MRQTLDKKLEVRISSGDLGRWQQTASSRGFRSVSEWARATLSDSCHGDAAGLLLDHDDRERAGGGSVAGAVGAEGDLNLGPRTTVLDNGVRVVTERILGSRTAALSVMVECGTRDENADEYGLAHLSEHMHFQGTNCRTARSILRQIDSLGGGVGAFTTRDYTTYYACVADDYCFLALDLLADLLLNSTYPEDALERERRVILEEIADLNDDPSRFIETRLKAAIWPGSALGRPITGLPDTVGAAMRDDLIYFVHKHYTPDRVIVAAAGNIEHDDFVAQVRDCFWRMIGSSRPLPPQAPVFRRAEVPLSGKTNRCHFAFALPAFGFVHPRRYALHALNRVLGGAVSSRLFRKLREELGLVYQVNSDYQAFRDGGLWLMEGSTSSENRLGTFEAVWGELDNLASGRVPVDDEETWLAKTQLRSMHLLGSQDAYTVMSRLGTQTLYFGRSLPSGQILEEIDRVTTDELNHLVKDSLKPWLPDLALCWFGPEPAERTDGRPADRAAERQSFLDSIRSRELVCSA